MSIERTPRNHWSRTDLVGFSRLLAEGVLAATRLTETVHQNALDTIQLRRPRQSGQTRGITGLVYRSIALTTRGVGLSASYLLERLPESPAIGSTANSVENGATAETLAKAGVSLARLTTLSVLNGVLGDYLHDSRNTLALPMSLHEAGGAAFCNGSPVAVRLAAAGSEQPPHIVLFIHGLCMHDLQWQTEVRDAEAATTAEVADGESTVHQLAGKGLRFPDLLREASQSTGAMHGLFLRYNSGRHVSENGRTMAQLLDEVWASEVPADTRLSIVAHSMGGLVARSALHYAGLAKHRWAKQVQTLVCLGTPHHGAPLEKAGNWVDRLLAVTPWTLPFASLGQLRSAGITDLRSGNVQDGDWQQRGRFEPGSDCRLPTPLPSGIRACAVAATLSVGPGRWRDAALGDGLVPLASALGEHPDSKLALAFPPQYQLVLRGTSHLGMLVHPEAAQKLISWLLH